MSKKLLTKDYSTYVFDAFRLPEEDFYNHYLNFVEENLKYNPDIVIKLVKAVEFWIDWYNSQIYGHFVERSNPDGNIEYVNSKQTFSINEKGEEVRNDITKTSVPLFSEFGINRHVNRTFFDAQLRDLEIIQESINLKNSLISFYKALPIDYKEQIGENSIPNGLDIEDLREAMEAVKKVSTPELKEEDKIYREETLKDIITHIESSNIVDNLKVQYKNIKGKRLKLLLKALQDLNLLPKERIAQKFHNYCRKEFDWEIASYTAMNDYRYNERTDKEEFENMKVYLKTLTNK